MLTAEPGFDPRHLARRGCVEPHFRLTFESHCASPFVERLSGTRLRENLEWILLAGFERAGSDKPQQPRSCPVANGQVGRVRRDALIAAAQATHRSRSTPVGLAASRDIAVAELQPGTLGQDEVRPDRLDGLWVLGGKFEPDNGVVAVHGIAAYNSRGRIIPDSDVLGFILWFSVDGGILLTCGTGMGL